MLVRIGVLLHQITALEQRPIEGEEAWVHHQDLRLLVEEIQAVIVQRIGRK